MEAKLEDVLLVKAEKIVGSIKGKQLLLESEANRILSLEVSKSNDKLDANYWCTATTGEALKKLNYMTLQNFNYIETMGVVAVVRYVFEVSIWLKLFKKNSSYGYVYYSELIKTQTRYWDKSKERLESEISFLQSVGEKEKELIQRELAIANSATGTEKENLLQTMYSRVNKEIDASAARTFSLYSEQAIINGYEYQAHMIKEKALPEAISSQKQMQTEKDEFQSTIAEKITDISAKRWNWRDKAQLVGMIEEYDYIYMLTSTLLHATPASITTDAKNLTKPELVMFLRYIDVKLKDVLELSSDIK